jgi:glutamine amidotransferase
MWAIDPELFAGIVGSTDTEVVFRLALTFGLEEDPIRALERTVRVIETTATERGVAPMVQGTFGVSDGSSLWAVRYATEGRARSLFASAEVDSLHQLYPEKKMWFATATSGDRLIASEPFSDLPGVWHEIDESSAVIVRSGGQLEHEPFRP